MRLFGATFLALAAFSQSAIADADGQAGLTHIECVARDMTDINDYAFSDTEVFQVLGRYGGTLRYAPLCDISNPDELLQRKMLEAREGRRQLREEGRNVQPFFSPSYCKIGADRITVIGRDEKEPIKTDLYFDRSNGELRLVVTSPSRKTKSHMYDCAPGKLTIEKKKNEF